MNEVRSLVAMAHVLDVSRSIEFYRKLGFEIGNTFTPDGAAEPTWVRLASSDAHLMVARGGGGADGSPAAGGPLRPVLRRRSRHEGDAREGGDRRRGPIGYVRAAGEFRVEDPDGYVLMITHN